MKTEIYINNTRIDLTDDADVRLNYQINDLREIDVRQTNFSYTITIPGSRTNNVLFGHIYELGNDNTNFNPNKKANVQVYVDGNQVLRGYAQLLNIFKDNTNNITYEVVLYGSLGNFFSSIPDNDLSDFSFNEYNHKYTRTNIRNSWATSIIKNGSSQAFLKGRGYLYPMAQHGNNSTNEFSVEEWMPGIYAKEYVDKIFEEANYTYSSKFLTGDYFKKLVIPFTKEKLLLTQEQIDQREVQASRTSTNSVLNRTPTIAGNFTQVPIFNTEAKDALGAFNSGYVWSCQKKGDYTLNISLLLGAFMDTVPPVYPFYVVGLNFTATVRLIKNGSVIYTIPTTVSISSGPFYVGVEFPATQNITYDVAANLGDYYYFDIVWNIPSSSYASKIVNNIGQAIPGNIQFRVKPNSTFSVVCNNDGVQEGDDVFMNQAVPEGISKRDFISSIFKMFNLMVVEDTKQDNNLIIEPRDDFFRSAGQFYDWSYKLDRSSIKISPLSELLDKKFVYSYKEDKDQYNKAYSDSYREVYGTFNYEVDNDFLNSQKDIDIIFSPTPNASDLGTGLSMPHFLTYDNNGSPKPLNTNIRILFYDGLKTGTFIFKSTVESPNLLDEYSYPYVGMQNDPDNPTEDLCFGTPKEVYYGQQTWTDSTLFNKFHYNTLREITDKNSKLLTGYFDLTPVDIANFDFRNKVYIDGLYWRVNKIEDYSPTNNELTKVELFSPIDPNLFVPKRAGVQRGSWTGLTALPELPVSDLSNPTGTTTTGVGPGVYGPAVNLSPGLRSSQINGNVVSSPDSLVLGRDNSVPATTSIVVNGNSNQVGTSGSSITVIGSGSTIGSDLRNVIILGSDDKIVSTSNIVILGDSYVIREGSGLIPIIDLIDGGEDEVQNPYNAVVPIDVVDSGLNSARPYGSDSVVHVVDSGQDIVNPQSY